MVLNPGRYQRLRINNGKADRYRLLVSIPIHGPGQRRYILEKKFRTWRIHQARNGLINGMAGHMHSHTFTWFCQVVISRTASGSNIRPIPWSASEPDQYRLRCASRVVNSIPSIVSE